METFNCWISSRPNHKELFAKVRTVEYLEQEWKRNRCSLKLWKQSFETWGNHCYEWGSSHNVVEGDQQWEPNRKWIGTLIHCLNAYINYLVYIDSSAGWGNLHDYALSCTWFRNYSSFSSSTSLQSKEKVQISENCCSFRSICCCHVGQLILLIQLTTWRQR